MNDDNALYDLNKSEVISSTTGLSDILPPQAPKLTDKVQERLEEIWPKSTSTIEKDKELTGGRVNYYLANVPHPQRENQPAYTAECEDIIEALEMNPDESNTFKAIWRSAAARLDRGKPGHKALYDAEKMVHYTGRILRRLRRVTSDEKSDNTG